MSESFNTFTIDCLIDMSIKNSTRKIEHERKIAMIVAEITKPHKPSNRKPAGKSKKTPKNQAIIHSVKPESHVLHFISSTTLYTIKFSILYDAKFVMQRNNISKVFIFEKFNVIAIERIDEKIKNRDTIAHFMYVVIFFTNFKNFCQQIINESND